MPATKSPTCAPLQHLWNPATNYPTCVQNSIEDTTTAKEQPATNAKQSHIAYWVLTLHTSTSHAKAIFYPIAGYPSQSCLYNNVMLHPRYTGNNKHYPTWTYPHTCYKTRIMTTNHVPQWVPNEAPYRTANIHQWVPNKAPSILLTAATITAAKIYGNNNSQLPKTCQQMAK
jgi:hypothetical protein